ncbi:MAG: hypothetical protein AWU57_378 [Marinobacter sp. T13-3]|nr:MAG: hypothetical protein AWU57_378 [Marinobacter sp. T13-3]
MRRHKKTRQRRVRLCCGVVWVYLREKEHKVMVTDLSERYRVAIPREVTKPVTIIISPEGAHNQ